MQENGITFEDWRLLQDFVHKKSVELMAHERKPFAITGLDASHWRVWTIGKRRFFMVSTNVFSEIMESVLVEAVERFPEKFGTGDAEDVIDAVYGIEAFGPRKDFTDYLRTENFGYVLEIAEGVVNERVLRIDLFRMIKPRKVGQRDFVGGAFHVLKHYSYDGIPLSTHRAVHDIHPRFVIHIVTKAFFIDIGHGTKIAQDAYEVAAPLDDEYEQLVSFYYEGTTGVYFVNTAYKREKK
jgi:hypothetical protein